MKKRGSRRQVWNGTAQKTSGGLTRNDLMKNKRGKIVSKKKSAAGKVKYNTKFGLKQWNACFMEARKVCGIQGFVPCKKGTKLYEVIASKQNY